MPGRVSRIVIRCWVAKGGDEEVYGSSRRHGFIEVRRFDR
jgi:hypothetical protein